MRYSSKPNDQATRCAYKEKNRCVRCSRWLSRVLSVLIEGVMERKICYDTISIARRHTVGGLVEEKTDEDAMDGISLRCLAMRCQATGCCAPGAA